MKKKVVCPKSVTGEHIWRMGEVYGETYPIFGLVLFARRVIMMKMQVCQACGVQKLIKEYR